MLCLLTLTLTVLAQSRAFSSFQQSIPNGNNVDHPCKANYKWEGVGHINPNGGGERNSFGRDFSAAGYRWTRALCQMDSDLDGRTNGQELGDPSCVWQPGSIPQVTRGITNPGVCEPIDSMQCRQRSSFVNCELEGFESCDRINEPGTFSATFRYPLTQIPAEDTNYFCLTVDLPSNGDFHMVATEAVLDNLDVMHHMLLLGCPDNSPNEFPTPRPCGMGSSSCNDIIGAWTVGTPGNCFHEGTGYRIGASSYKRAVLQMCASQQMQRHVTIFVYFRNPKIDEIKPRVHWNNPFLRSDHFDSSGLRIYLQPAKPDVQDLAMFILGERMLKIPPGEPTVIAEGRCHSECLRTLISKPISVVNILNHMHYLGQSQKTEVFRNGTKIATLANDENYSYDSPVTHTFDPPFVILPGDELVTICEFNSLSSQRTVYQGDGTYDEMCFAFLTVYPADAFLKPYRQCVESGPLTSCEFFDFGAVDGCYWANFLNLDGEGMKATRDAMKKNCNAYGFCRPECYEVYKTIMDNPCLHGEMFEFIVHNFEQSKEGLEFLGHLMSCKESTTTMQPSNQVCTKESCTCPFK